MVRDEGYDQADGNAAAAPPRSAAMPAVDGDAVERLASGRRDGIQGRARVGICLVAGATLLGLVDDVFAHRAFLGPLAWVAVVQCAVLLGAWVAFRVPVFASRRRGVALLGTCGLCVTTGASGFYRGDPSETILLLVLICVVVGTLFPWGMRAQTILVTVAAGVGAGTALSSGRLDIVFGTSALLAVGSSIYAAYQLGRQRDEIRAGLRTILWGGAALEAVANGVVITDRAGQILWVNTAFSRQTGYSFAEAVGRNPRMLKSGAQAADVYADLWSTILGGRVWHGEIVNRRKDGSLYDEEMTITPWRSTGGPVTHFIAVKHDVTERKQAEEALRCAKREAEQANRAKSDFLAQMSHEIRTPMNAIMGMTELALDTALTAEQREYLDLVRTSTDALLDVVNDILELSKIEAGRLDLRPTPFRLRASLDSTVRTLAARAGEKHLRLSATVDAGVPDTLVGDAGRLRQVMVNLIGNAIKFTERGEVAVHIARAAAAAGAGPGAAPRPAGDGMPPAGSGVVLHCSVRDTGIGIPPDKQQVIFEPFEQGEQGARRRFGGSGLGLTISKRLVEQMEGRIWVESTPGAGSTFHFTARLGVADADAVAAAEGSLPPTTVPASTGAGVGPLDILLAEDNVVNQRLAVRLLEKRGHRVVVVGNGRAALEALATARFDLVLMDLEMPEMDGLTAATLLRERERAAAPPDGRAARVPIIAMTAHAMRSDEERCLAAGMDGFVTKPIRAAMLFASIEHIVGAAAGRARPAAHGEPIGSAA